MSPLPPRVDPASRPRLLAGFRLDKSAKLQPERVLHVSTVPFYWYIETVSLGQALEDLPWRIFGPAPTCTEAVLVDNSTGEIYGEAILMRALPWPRFRCFADGKQVLLPYWSAITLERLEAKFLSSGDPLKCACGLDHGPDRRSHFRVEVTDRKSFHFSFWDNTHFENAFPSRAKRNRSLPRRAAVSYREAKLRDQEPLA